MGGQIRSYVQVRFEMYKCKYLPVGNWSWPHIHFPTYFGPGLVIFHSVSAKLYPELPGIRSDSC